MKSIPGSLQDQLWDRIKSLNQIKHAAAATAAAATAAAAAAATATATAGAAATATATATAGAAAGEATAKMEKWIHSHIFYLIQYEHNELIQTVFFSISIYFIYAFLII